MPIRPRHTRPFLVLTITLATGAGALGQSAQALAMIERFQALDTAGLVIAASSEALPLLLAQETTATRRRVEVLKSNRTDQADAAASAAATEAPTAEADRAFNQNSSRSNNRTADTVTIDDDSDGDGTTEARQAGENPLYDGLRGETNSPLYKGSQR